MLNQALFSNNGGCGYVLKPWFLTAGAVAIGDLKEKKKYTWIVRTVVCLYFVVPLVRRR